MVIGSGLRRTFMRQSSDTTGDLVYTERVSSNKTAALFLALMTLFLSLLLWRVNVASWDVLAVIFLCFFVIFFFYSLNYRTLVIYLTSKSLKLKFGIFTWVVPLDNVEECCIDEIPLLMRMGGAGIHFMFIRKRYRASFNFLEYPRVVATFKRKVGPVRDISFSTRRPEDILQFLREAISANNNTKHRCPTDAPSTSPKVGS
jgi:Ca2+/Na+ antiporter